MITIFGAEWCAQCKQAKQYCESKGYEYKYIDIDDSEDERITRFRSLPQIFIDDVSVGGLKDFMQKVSG
jgi:glutaredoxin